MHACTYISISRVTNVYLDADTFITMYPKQYRESGECITWWVSRQKIYSNILNGCLLFLREYLPSFQGLCFLIYEIMGLDYINSEPFHVLTFDEKVKFR